MYKILVIIPAYNEEKSVNDVVEAVKKASRDFDVVVVNDASTDDTEKVLLKNQVRHINLPTNLGIGGAMQTGYKYAYENGYDLAVQVDGDGQHDPSEIQKLIDVREKTGADLVIGSRFIGEKSFQSSLLRRFGIAIFGIVTKLLIGQKISDATSGFRLANKNVIELYTQYYPSDYPEPEVIVYLKNHGLKVVETPVKMRSRQGGRSSITALKSVYYMIKVVGSMFMQKMKG